MAKQEIYFSIDIETVGPVPLVYSMISLGCAAYTADKELLSTFSMNLKELPYADRHPETMKWWKQFPEAWEASTSNPMPVSAVMREFVQWVQGVAYRSYGKPVAVAMPAGFDWTFVYTYLMKFAGESPFGFQCLDMKTYAMALLNSDFRSSTKRNWPKSWFDEFPHTHIAVQDAIEQGALFCNMLAHRNNMITPSTEEREFGSLEIGDRFLLGGNNFTKVSSTMARYKTTIEEWPFHQTCVVQHLIDKC